MESALNQFELFADKPVGAISVCRSILILEEIVNQIGIHWCVVFFINKFS